MVSPINRVSSAAAAAAYGRNSNQDKPRQNNGGGEQPKSGATFAVGAENSSSTVTSQGGSSEVVAGSLGSLVPRLPLTPEQKQQKVDQLRNDIFRFAEKRLGENFVTSSNITAESLPALIIKTGKLEFSVEVTDFETAQSKLAVIAVRQKMEELQRLLGPPSGSISEPVMPASLNNGRLTAWTPYTAANPFISAEEARGWLSQVAKIYAPESVGHFTQTITADNASIVAGYVAHAAKLFSTSSLGWNGLSLLKKNLYEAVNFIVHSELVKPYSSPEVYKGQRETELTRTLHVKVLRGGGGVASAAQAAKFVAALAEVSGQELPQRGATESPLVYFGRCAAEFQELLRSDHRDAPRSKLRSYQDQLNAEKINGDQGAFSGVDFYKSLEEAVRYLDQARDAVAISKAE